MRIKYLISVCALLCTFLSFSQNSLLYDGSNYVTVEDSNLTNFLDDYFSIEATIKQTVLPTNTHIITDYYSSNSTEGFSLFVNSAGKIVFKLNDQSYTFPNYVINNECHQISIVVKFPQISFYVDGVLLGTDSVSSSITNLPSTTDLYIGGTPSGNQNFIGEIDEVRLYNSNITSSWINNYLFTFLGTGVSGLAAYYDFNDITIPQIVVDESGNNNDGFLGDSNNLDSNDPLLIWQSCVAPITVATSYCGEISYTQQPYLEYENSEPEIDPISQLQLNQVYDDYGNRYDFENIKIDTTSSSSNRIFSSCNSGIFTLDFTDNSGMESTTDPVHAERRAVICQVFSDISDMIVSPLHSATSGETINIWVRDLNEITTSPNVLGAATTFYVIPEAPTVVNGGILDGEVWKTMHTGVDSYINVSNPLEPELAADLYYHGMMALNVSSINWNTDLSITSIPGGQRDMYSVVLHEVLHMLGFTTLINDDGTSRLGPGNNYYSRYDTYLLDPNGNYLISNTGACGSMYDYTFTANPNVLAPSCLGSNPPNESHDCNSIITFKGTSIVPVYNPGCYEPGSSLGHFEDQCYINPDTGVPYGNDNYFVMSNAISSVNVKRELTKEEFYTLCDLGLTLSDSSTGNSCNGARVAGTNDGLFDGVFTFRGFANTDIDLTNDINGNGILSNDTNALNFECLEDVYDATATITGTNFRSNVPGLHLLRYIPYNGLIRGNKRGNITYVYVFVIADINNCAVPDPCNLVPNGDFEQFSQLPDDISQLDRTCSWQTSGISTPDYYHVDATTTPPDRMLTIPCNFQGFEPDNIAGNRGYVGMFIIHNLPGSYYETILTELSAPLLPNIEYELSFDVSLSEANNFRSIQFQAYLSTTLVTQNGNAEELPIANPDMLFTNPTFSTITDGWERITFNIPARAVAGERFLYIGGLNSVSVTPNTPAPPTDTCNTYVNNGILRSYYYVDNVELIQLDDITLDLPDAICRDNIISDLEIYLSETHPGGEFSGTGVTDNIFDPGETGTGDFIITYSYTNNSNCLTEVTDTITVFTNCATPYISQIYEGGNFDQYVEIKNPDLGQAIASGTYYLVLYADGADTSGVPTSAVNIGALAPEEAVYFKHLGAVSPAFYELSTTNFLSFNFNFDGIDDLIILSTTNDDTAFLNRIDLVGNDSNWGNSQSLARSSCAQQYPRVDAFEACDWASFTLNEIDTDYDQNSKTNAILGRHFTDVLIYLPGGWTDIGGVGFSNPDHTRVVEIQEDYNTNTLGSFQACSLEVNLFQTLTIAAEYYIRVQKNVNVQTGATLDIENQGSLVMVHDGCYGVWGTDLIVIADGDNIEVTTQTVGLEASTDYVYWSSPLSDNSSNLPANSVANLFPVASGFPSNRFYGFNNAVFYDQFDGSYPQTTGVADSFDDNGDDYFILNATERDQLMIPGRGYATWPNGATNYTVNFSGQTNNGIVTVSLYRNDSAAGDNANLIGNPYPSPISLDRLFEVNNNLIDPVAYIWGRIDDDPSGGNGGPDPINYTPDNFLVYNPNMLIIPPFFDATNEFNDDGLLASCQSFFVNTITDPTILFEANTGTIQYAGSLIFNNSMRSILPNDTFVRMQDDNGDKIKDTKLWLNLVNNSKSYGSQVGIAFLNNASSDFNSKEDVKVHYGNTLNFYTTGTEKDLIIDCQDSFNDKKVIPLGFTHLEGASEILSLSIAKTEGILDNRSIYLEDSVLNCIHDLSESDYDFEAIKGVHDNRFYLHFVESNSMENQNQTQDVKVYTKNSTVFVSSIENNIDQVIIRDIHTAHFGGVDIANKKQIHKKNVALPIAKEYRLIQVTVILEDGSLYTKKLML